MMMIVRVFPKGDLSDTWARVLSNPEKISNRDCTPLYASQQEEKEFMSIIYPAGRKCYWKSWKTQIQPDDGGATGNQPHDLD